MLSNHQGHLESRLNLSLFGDALDPAKPDWEIAFEIRMPINENAPFSTTGREDA